MTLTPAEQAAIDAHAAELGVSTGEYIHQTAARRALAWQSERQVFREIAEWRGTTVEAMVKRGSLSDF